MHIVLEHERENRKLHRRVKIHSTETMNLYNENFECAMKKLCIFMGLLDLVLASAISIFIQKIDQEITRSELHPKKRPWV